MSGKGEQLKYLGIAVLGGVAGLVAGVLMAPASGRETRRKLAYRLDQSRSLFARRRRGWPDPVEYPYLEVVNG